MRSKHTLRIFVFKAFTAAILCSSDLYSQQEPISTDRPDQTESAFTVPANHIQFESGFGYDKFETEEVYSYPSLLIRYGLSENFELRLETEFSRIKFTDTQEGSGSNQGMSPIELGCKIKIAEENGILPTTSFIGHLSIPKLASKDFTSSYYASSFRFTMQHTLSDRFSLGYNAGAEWNGDTPEPVFIYTATTGFSILDNLGSYIELYGFAPQNSKAEHRMDGGLTFQPRKNIQIDLSGGIDLNGNPFDYFAALGFSMRFPD